MGKKFFELHDCESVDNIARSLCIRLYLKNRRIQAVKGYKVLIQLKLNSEHQKLERGYHFGIVFII